MSKYFKQTEDEILFDLIERDNPGLTPKLTAQNCYITTPHPNTGPDALLYNTIATVRPRFGSGLHGPVQIKYNRVDLKDLFKDMSPLVLSGFSENEQYATRAELPKIIATCYSLPINKDDVDPATTANHYIQGHAEHGKGIFRIANNKCFIGQIGIAFRRDKLEHISSLIDPPVLNGMPTAPATARGLEDARLPAPWAYFSDFDFTEIIGHVDHKNNLTEANISAIAAFTGMPLQMVNAPFDPACPYKTYNHFGFTIADNAASLNLVGSLRGKYPWLNTKYTHVKITTGQYDPVSGALIPEDRRPIFAFYYNKYTV